jgi:hypothetical protein
MTASVRLRLIALGVCALALLESGCRAFAPYRPTPMPSMTPAPQLALPPDPPTVGGGPGQTPPATAQIAPVGYGPLPQCLAPADVQATVTYPAGWSLIAGSAGSCLNGATAAYLVLTTNTPLPHVTYQPAPVTAGLVADQAYWVYFPSGGSLALASATYLPEPQVPTTASDLACSWSLGTPANWIALANGSPSGPLDVISGARTTLLYQPGQGYSAATTIPIGHAAWVWPAGSAIAWSPAPFATAVASSCP